MPGIPMSAAGIAAVASFDVSGTPLQVPTKTYTIAGVTRDSTGAALASCAVRLVRTADNSVAAVGTSDGSGAYSLGASPAITHYAVAYKAGSPDVAGTTVNTLVGS
jgi:hypothetical protein